MWSSSAERRETRAELAGTTQICHCPEEALSSTPVSTPASDRFMVLREIKLSCGWNLISSLVIKHLQPGFAAQCYRWERGAAEQQLIIQGNPLCVFHEQEENGADPECVTASVSCRAPTSRGLCGIRQRWVEAGTWLQTFPGWQILREQCSAPRVRTSQGLIRAVSRTGTI